MCGKTLWSIGKKVLAELSRCQHPEKKLTQDFRTQIMREYSSLSEQDIKTKIVYYLNILRLPV